jgi:hypothetical protein
MVGMRATLHTSVKLEHVCLRDFHGVVILLGYPGTSSCVVMLVAYM